MAPITVPARARWSEPWLNEQENNVSGDHANQDRRPREHRQHDRQSGNKGDSDGGSNNRNRNRRPGGGSGKKGIYRFEDQLEHDICQLVTHKAPKGFPVFNRSDLAILPLAEVARTERRILLCNGLHEGPHIWPNGDETSTESETIVVVTESIEPENDASEPS